MFISLDFKVRERPYSQKSFDIFGRSNVRNNGKKKGVNEGRGMGNLELAFPPFRTTSKQINEDISLLE